MTKISNIIKKALNVAHMRTLKIYKVIKLLPTLVNTFNESLKFLLIFRKIKINHLFLNNVKEISKNLNYI